MRAPKKRCPRLRLVIRKDVSVHHHHNSVVGPHHASAKHHHIVNLPSRLNCIRLVHQVLCRLYNVPQFLLYVPVRHRRRRSSDLALKRLLLGALGLGRDLEALLGGVENGLNLLEQALVLFKLGIRFHGLLNQQLNVAQLAKVKVALTLQARHRLLERRVFLAQSGARGSSARRQGCTGTRCGRVGGSGCSSGGRGSGAGCGSRGDAALALAAGNGVVIVAWEVLVPVLLDELEELEVVLHLALYERLDADGLVDLVLGERV
ncbi:hypothetical protein IG631_23494 [Alternaria alternata]|nr:hypothetical protein IG631_23494 [Alternaria alternata]